MCSAHVSTIRDGDALQISHVENCPFLLNSSGKITSLDVSRCASLLGLTLSAIIFVEPIGVTLSLVTQRSYSGIQRHKRSTLTNLSSAAIASRSDLMFC